MTDKLERIVINGGGLHGWSAAAYLGIALRHHSVSMVVVDEGPIAPEILSTDTSVHDFHRTLGIKEVDLVGRVGGAYKYGTLFKHWCMTNQSEFVHTWSPVGEMIERVPFHHYVSRQHLRDDSLSLEPFSIAASAAGEQRFSHPEPGTPLERLDYALHLDATRYLHFLQGFALDQGVEGITAKIEQVSRDSESGVVTQVTLNTGDTLVADFYIDVTAESPLGDAFREHDTFDSWSTWFPCDRRLEIIRHEEASTPVTNSVRRTESGWHKINPLAGTRFDAVSYCSDLATDDAVLDSLQVSVADNFSPESLRTVEQRVGLQRLLWTNNVLRLGPAAGFAEAILFEPLHFTHTALARWLDLLPGKHVNTNLVRQYNHATHIEYEHVRDAHAILLATMSAGRCGLGRRVEDVDWPDTLQHRIHLFRETGRIAFYEGDVLDKQQWMQLLIGCGVWPQRYDPLLGVHRDKEVERCLLQTAAMVKQTVAKMPPHDALLNAIRNSTRT